MTESPAAASRFRIRIVVLVVLAHLAACGGLLLASPGTEMEPSVDARFAWVTSHSTLWAALWGAWMVSSTSLLALFLVWRARLLELGASPHATLLGCALCGLGVPFDVAGEILQIFWVPGSPDVATFQRLTDLYTVLGPVVANGAYCVGGLVMSAVAWHVGMQRGAPGVLGSTVWVAGLGLTAAGVAEDRVGLVGFGAAVMTLFIPWAIVLGRQMQGRTP